MGLTSSVSIGDLVALIAALSAALVNVITAIRSRERDGVTQAKVEAVHQEVRPPSNGKTAGTLQENATYALHTIASIMAAEHGASPPPPIEQVGPVPQRPEPLMTTDPPERP